MAVMVVTFFKGAAAKNGRYGKRLKKVPGVWEMSAQGPPMMGEDGKYAYGC